MAAQRILVIKLGALGDFVQALGPMQAIRAYHTDDHITLLTTAAFRALGEASSYFNDIIIDSRPKFYQIGQWLKLRAALNAGQFTRVYDLQNNDRTDLYAKLFVPKPEWVGAGRGATIRNTSPERTAGLAYHGHVQTLALAHISGVTIDRMEWVKGRDDFPGLKKPYILLVPGAAPTRPKKRWPVEYYSSIAVKLAQRGLQPVILGSGTEKDLGKIIAAACPEALDLTAQTALFDIVALARNACGAIGNDTGPMHMIAPTGVPCVVLFSNDSDPVRNTPLGTRVATLQEKDLKTLSADRVWEKFLAYADLPS